MYDFSTGAWVPSGHGWCNANSHSQYGCVAEPHKSNEWPEGGRGVRIHYGSRDASGDGGSCAQIYEHWTGWDGLYGSDQKLVGNFDSWSGKDGPVELFY
eukprot:gene9017-4040_t